LAHPFWVRHCPAAAVFLLLPALTSCKRVGRGHGVETEPTVVTPPRRSQPGSDLLPGDATTVMSLDVARARTTSAWADLAATPTWAKQLATLRSSCGFDPVAAVDEIWMAADSKDDMSIVVTGADLDPAKLARCWPASSTDTYGGATLSHSGGWEWAPLDGALVVASNGKWAHAMIDRAAGHGSSPSTLIEELPGGSPPPMMRMVSAVDAAAGAASGYAKGMTRLTASADLTKSIVISVSMSFDTPTDGAAFESTLKADAQALVEAVDPGARSTVKLAGSTVTLDVEVDPMKAAAFVTSGFGP
jgi:hypothetical protein